MISEESMMMKFPAVTIREAIERPEALDTGSIIITGLDAGEGTFVLVGVLHWLANALDDIPQVIEVTNGDWLLRCDDDFRGGN